MRISCVLLHSAAAEGPGNLRFVVVTHSLQCSENWSGKARSVSRSHFPKAQESRGEFATLTGFVCFLGSEACVAEGRGAAGDAKSGSFRPRNVLRDSLIAALCFAIFVCVVMSLQPRGISQDGKCHQFLCGDSLCNRDSS